MEHVSQRGGARTSRAARAPFRGPGGHPQLQRSVTVAVRRPSCSGLAARPLHIPTDTVSSWRVRMAGPVRSVSPDMRPQYGKFQKSTPDMNHHMRMRTLVLWGRQPVVAAQTVA